MPPGFGGSPNIAVPLPFNPPAAAFVPQPARTQVPAVWQAAPIQPSAQQPLMPVNAAMAGNTAPRPTIRLQAPDMPTVADRPLALPSPETLGIGAVRLGQPITAAEIDWNDVRPRLRRLGAVGFHLDQVAGQWRATLLLPASDQTTRHVEASAASDAAAVGGVLQKAEAIVLRR